MLRFVFFADFSLQQLTRLKVQWKSEYDWKTRLQTSKKKFARELVRLKKAKRIRRETEANARMSLVKNRRLRRKAKKKE